MITKYVIIFTGGLVAMSFVIDLIKALGAN